MKTSSLTAISLLAITLLLFGCKNEPPEPSEDLVLFTLPDVNLSVKTVDRFTTHSSGCTAIPLPSDSSANILVDLDRDSYNDVLITLAHWYNDTLLDGPTTPCDSFQYYATVQALHFLDSISIIPNNEQTTNLFEEGEDIDAQLGTWGRKGFIFNSDPSGDWPEDFTEEAYIGVKLRWEDEWNMGWILIERNDHTLRVKEYGVNLSRNRPIRAGQRQ